MAIERNINRLSADLQAEICKTEDLLTDGIAEEPQPQFASFHMKGTDYIAYYVPYESPEGPMQYVFECLIY